MSSWSPLCSLTTAISWLSFCCPRDLCCGFLFFTHNPLYLSQSRSFPSALDTCPHHIPPGCPHFAWSMAPAMGWKVWDVPCCPLCTFSSFIWALHACQASELFVSWVPSSVRNTATLMSAQTLSFFLNFSPYFMCCIDLLKDLTLLIFKLHVGVCCLFFWPVRIFYDLPCSFPNIW